MRPGAACRCCWSSRTTSRAHTSSWSTKLIHGGLRYLEYYEFRLVAEALAEREVLLRIAPHLVEPLAFVLPHEPHLRPAWMIRAGLFLYDRLGGRHDAAEIVRRRARRRALGRRARSRASATASSTPTRASTMRGSSSLNALDAQARGAEIRVRTRLVRARRDGGVWRATLRPADGAHDEVAARAIVNAAGPWVKDVLDSVRPATGEGERAAREGQPHRGAARARRGARVHPAERRQPHRVRHSVPGALLADRHDRRPGRRVSSIRRSPTTRSTTCSRSPTPTSSGRSSRADIVWTYSGVRPLYDDGASDPSAVTRDYVLKVDALPATRRRRARAGAVDLRRQDHDVPQAGRARARRARAVLSGDEGPVDARRAAAGRRPAEPRPRRVGRASCRRRYPQLPPSLLRALARATARAR